LEFTDYAYYFVGLFVIALLGSFFLWKIKFSKLDG
ncbi:nickel transporter NixA, partial [Helicobacter pylori]